MNSCRLHRIAQHQVKRRLDVIVLVEHLTDTLVAARERRGGAKNRMKDWKDANEGVGGWKGAGCSRESTKSMRSPPHGLRK